MCPALFVVAAEMQKITRNVRLGFGSFVDKVALPYVNMMPAQLLSPCSGCESPYSFRNRLSLTEDVAQFGVRVNATPVSGNQDSPEGGFDAIVQAIKCNVSACRLWFPLSFITGFSDRGIANIVP